METVGLTAAIRQVGRKGHLRSLKEQGQLPGVIYGQNAGSTPIQVPTKEIEKIISSRVGLNALIQLKIEGENTEKPMVMIKEIQREPIRGNLIHIDLHQISLRDKLQTEVPVILLGTPEGVKAGGLLQVGARSVEVECLPTNIPESLSVDVSNLNIGDKLTVADLIVPDGVEVTADTDTLLVSVMSPKAEEEPVAAPEAEQSEPAEKQEPEKQE